MIEKVMEYNRAFDSLAKQDSNYIYAPSMKDWEKAAVLCKVLKVFYDATMLISGTSYPTANLYFHEMWK
jgi:malate synthase